MRRFSFHRLAPAFGALLLLAGCAGDEADPIVCLSPADVTAERSIEPPPAPACDDPALESHDGLLVLAPHPDDEVLGFAGLIDSYVRQGKPVEVVVVTDGDAYCEACRFWKSGSVTGPTCTAEELSNLATPEVDSFAEVRREESRRAMTALGAPEPVFLGYPDVGLRISWTASRLGEGDQTLRRSDFSECDDCETCATGWATGPETGLTPDTLLATLAERLAATSPGTLLATTHPLDRHGDHAALGNLVKTTNDALETPRPVAYAVIHAHTSKDLPFPECWYPAPRAIQCGCAEETCAEEDPEWIAALRAHRDRPDWPAALPDDADYGEPTQLCLPEEVWQGPDARKRRAIEAHASQIGNAIRDGEPEPHLRGILDCNGYLGSFVRSTEVFVLSEGTRAAECDPTGTWTGDRAEATSEDRPAWSPAELTIERGEGGDLTGRLTWSGAEGEEKAAELRVQADPACRLTLTTDGPGSREIRATVSRDAQSLYATWSDPAGYLTLHR